MKIPLFGKFFADPLKVSLVNPDTPHDFFHDACVQIDQGLESLKASHSLSGEPDFFELIRLAEASEAQRSLQAQEQEARTSMKQEIEGLHERLGTKLTPLDCERLQRGLDAHFLVPSLQGLEELIDRQVLAFLFLQTGPMAWDEFSGFLERSDDKLLGRSSAIKNQALPLSPFQTRHLISGVVPVWKHAYPEKEWSLWLETALLGVFSALRARLLLRAVQIWFQREPALDQQLLATLQLQLQKLRSVSTLGGRLDDMANLKLELDAACKEVIPELVWSNLVSKLTSENALEPVGSVLDPVCWMRLQPARAAASVEISHRTYYFCHRGCKERFMGEPDKYLAPGVIQGGKKC